MISDQAAVFPKVVWDLETPRRAIRNALGVATLHRLHQASHAWDVALFIGSWLLVAATTTALILLPWGAPWVLAGVLQQIGTMNCLHSVRHDLFFHRRVGGRRGEVLAILCSLPIFSAYTAFLQHGDHHHHVGWDLFEETFAHLDRRWKRWLCLTCIGVFLMLAGKLRAADTPRPNQSFTAPAAFRQRLRSEQRVHRIFLLLLLGAAIFWPTAVLKGVVLPLLLFAPLVLMFRIVCQHTETDPQNPFHLSVYYRPNRLLGLLFFDTLGAAHLIHHIYPRIPIYRVAEAACLMHPVLIRHNVPERGLAEVLWRYFVRGDAYRERWSTVSQAVGT